MYVPAGIRMRSFITNGNDVSAYTASPSRAFLVEIACLSERGTFEPDGMTQPFASCSVLPVSADSEGLAVLEPCAEFWTAGAVAGLAASGACPQAIPETRSRVRITRIRHLTGRSEE